MKAKELPSLEYLNECFELSEDSPSGLIWKVRPRYHFNSNSGWKCFNTQKSGKFAGNILVNPKTSVRYWQVSIIRKLYFSHRIIYSIIKKFNVLPGIEIDHEDGNGMNNKINNLRSASRSQNCQNARIRKDNSSGIKGVYWHEGYKAWIGQIMANKIRYATYPCPTPEIAGELLNELRQSLHKEFQNHGA